MDRGRGKNKYVKPEYSLYQKDVQTVLKLNTISTY